MIRIIESKEYSGWNEEDIKLHKSIDWKSRYYNDYPVYDDNFMGTAVKYSENSPEEKAKVKFVKWLRANPIFPPYYEPDYDPFADCGAPSYDGNKHNGYMVMDRYDTQELSDMLSR